MHHGSIRGRVVRDNSEPVTDATIIIVRGPGPAPDIAPLTDSNGSFALEGLPAGDWHLQVRSPGGETGEQIVRVANDSPTNATIIVKPVKKQRSKH